MIPKLVEGVVTAELPEGDVIVSSADETKAVIVNAMGATVLDLCDGERTVADIAAFIVTELGDEAGIPTQAQVERDVGEIVERLVAAGLLDDCL